MSRWHGLALARSSELEDAPAQRARRVAQVCTQAYRERLARAAKVAICLSNAGRTAREHLSSIRGSVTMAGVGRRRASLRTLKRGLLARLAAGVLLFSAVPGADLLLLDAVHLALHGHVADEAGHEHVEDDGDCCSGLFHLCACHHQIASLGGLSVRIALASAGLLVGVSDAAVLRLTGYRAALYRPPSV